MRLSLGLLRQRSNFTERLAHADTKRAAACLLCTLLMLSYNKRSWAFESQYAAAIKAGWCRAGARRTILFLSYSTTRRPAGSVGSDARSTGMKLCSSSVLYPDCAHTSPLTQHYTQGMHSHLLQRTIAGSALRAWRGAPCCAKATD